MTIKSSEENFNKFLNIRKKFILQNSIFFLKKIIIYNWKSKKEHSLRERNISYRFPTMRKWRRQKLSITRTRSKEFYVTNRSLRVLPTPRHKIFTQIYLTSLGYLPTISRISDFSSDIVACIKIDWDLVHRVYLSFRRICPFLDVNYEF